MYEKTNTTYDPIYKNGKIEIPDSEYKRKYEKPKHDPRESEIWY